MGSDTIPPYFRHCWWTNGMTALSPTILFLMCNSPCCYLAKEGVGPQVVSNLVSEALPEAVSWEMSNRIRSNDDSDLYFSFIYLLLLECFQLSMYTAVGPAKHMVWRISITPHDCLLQPFSSQFLCCILRPMHCWVVCLQWLHMSHSCLPHSESCRVQNRRGNHLVNHKLGL